MSEPGEIDQVKKIVRKTFEQDFANVEIDRIITEEDVTFDGDPMIRIDVVYAGSVKDMDASKIPGFFSHVMDALEGAGQKAFPLFSFITKGDYAHGRT